MEFKLISIEEGFTRYLKFQYGMIIAYRNKLITLDILVALKLHEAMNLLKLIALTLSFLFSFNNLLATHLKGGHIEFKSVSNNNLTYEFKVILSNDTGSEVIPGSGVLDFGDGNHVSLNENATLDKVIFEGEEFGIYTYTIEHSYGALGNYTISYSELNRNAGVKNMANSVDTPIYIETKLIIDSLLGKNNSPVINNLFFQKSLNSFILLYNPMISDEDGDSVSYHLITPKQGSQIEVFDYSLPSHPDFYPSDTYLNEAQNGQPIFEISPFDGNLIWDVPRFMGEYSAAIKIKEWRVVEGELFNISSIVYDFQMIIAENDQLIPRPILTIPATQCYNDDLNEIFEIQSNDQLIKIEFYSDAENAKINGVLVQDFVFNETHSKEDIVFEFSLATKDATKGYHQAAINVSQKLEDGSFYEWSQGYTFGFNCETIERVITSIPSELKHNLIHIVYQKGRILLNTNSEFSGPVKIKLYDLNGKIVLNSVEKFINGKSNLNMPFLKNGIYLLTTESNQEYLRSKLLVNN